MRHRRSRRAGLILALACPMLAGVGCSGEYGFGGSSGPPAADRADRAAHPEPTARTRVREAAPRHPFGAHDFAYAEGTIAPSAPREVRDEITARRYDAWKAKYLSAGCGEGRWYVDMRADAARKLYGHMDPDSISISEGHGYGMTIVARMAGHDPDARVLFDGMVRFREEHPADSDPALMGWDQVLGCGPAPRGGTGTATDGDLDVAYALLLADAQWGSDGAIDYRGEAAETIAAIMTHELDPDTALPTLGDWVSNAPARFRTAARTSDLMPAHFRAFAALYAPGAEARATWGRAVDASYALVAALQASDAPATGLLPDFALDAGGEPYPAYAGFMEGTKDGAYGFNACRVPYRLGADLLASGDPRARRALAAITRWAEAKTGGDPTRVAGGYALWGDRLWGAAPNELAFIAPLGVAAMASPEHQAWLDAIWGSLAARPMEDDPYYGNTLALLAMLAMSENAWSP